MSLRISSKRVSNSEIVSFDILTLHTEHEAYKSQMFSDTVRTVFDPKDTQNLYVFQGELAIVRPNKDSKKVQYIVTDDTTTCITVVIRHIRTGLTCQIHCDTLENDPQTLEKFCDLLQNMLKIASTCPTMNDRPTPECAFNLSLFGGYLDERGTSENLFVTLMILLNSIGNNIELHLCCAITGKQNTTQKLISADDRSVPAPKLYGVATNLITGHMYDAVLDHSNIDCLPLTILRRSMLIWERKFFWNIYNTQQDRIEIEPRKITRHLPFIGEYLRSQSSMPDDMILKNCSTSPFVEPEHFVREYRQMISFLSKNYGPQLYQQFFPDGSNHARIFIVKDRKWTEFKCVNE